ncbi:MAG: metallophosphoesterase [Planctomycetota bacterium]|nr:metallophosphoesterase [Planctomycetota bacterium]
MEQLHFVNSTEIHPWTFLHVNDSHLGSPRSYRFRPAINQRWAAIKSQIEQEPADLLLHGGDLTRDGQTHSFELRQAAEDLQTIPFPVHVIPGNMDVGNKHTCVNGAKKRWDPLGLGWYDPELNMTADRLELFAKIYGPINWTFIHKDVRFSGFYAAVAGSGLPQEQPFWDFLESLSTLAPARHHVAVMHYWLFMEHPDESDWDLTNEDEYDNWYFSISPPHRQRIWKLLKQANVQILFCGHVHTARPVQELEGIRIYRTQAAGNTAQLTDRWEQIDTRFGYHRCTVNETCIDVEFILGNDQCQEFGTYGPLGHPSVKDRDYGAAQEHPPIQPD